MTRRLQKLAVASRLIIRHPTELIDRVISRWEARHDLTGVPSAAIDWPPFMVQLGAICGPDAISAIDDRAVALLESELLQSVPTINRGPLGPLSNADLTLAKTCYALCRALKPACVVETGVAYGMSSSFFLAALEANGSGILHSIDLPALADNAEEYVGALIPKRLKGRWRLHRGSTRRILPNLVAHIDDIGIFLHDSLHTYSSVSQDLRVVVPHLARRAAVLVDDVDLNDAFSEWAALAAPTFSTVVHQVQKRSRFGVAVFT